MQQKRILVLFGNIPLHGQERSNIQVMTCLQEAGAEVLFLTNDEYGHESIQPMLDSLNLPWTEARFPRLLGKSTSPAEWLDRFARISRYNGGLLRAIRSFRPTHIHVANENHLLAALPTLLSIKTPIVFRLGDEPRAHLGVFRWLWRNIYAKRIRSVVCISRFIADRLEDVSGRSADSVIYNYPPERRVVRDPFSLPPFDGLTCTYFGQLTQKKGVDRLFECALEVCRSRSDVRFVFAGDYLWQNTFATDLIRRAEESGLSDRILFPGFVEDIPGLLAGSDVHVCPSVWEEPLGNVVVEAKLAGIPSIVFPSGGLPELVSHGVDGFICASKTHEALRDGLLHYLDAGSDYRKRSGREARNSLERLGITRQKFTAAWRNVYDEAS